MKKIFFSLIALMVLSPSMINAQEKYISAGISHVTVFSQGAQLFSEITTQIQPGTVDLVAGGLSPYIDINSIQVKGEGDFMILSVNHRNNFLENPEESAKTAELRDKIESLRTRIEDETTAISVLLEKEAFLRANYDVVTNKTTITSEQLKSFLDLYTVNTESTKFAILKKQRLVKDFEKEKQQLENQLNNSSAKSRLPTGEIVISVSSTKQVNGKLKLSYVVMNAGWYPSYDIRVDDISAPASIIYKANIYQNTGIDWKDVKVSLSNASPMTAGALPTLYPWFIDFYNPPVYRALKGKAAGIQVSQAREMKSEALSMDEVFAEEAAPVPVTITESAISFSFDINVPQTILSNGKPETAELQRMTVPAAFRYESVPKVNPSAYLVGYLTGWEKYNLLAGGTNIYFNNTFTGKGQINTAELTDSLTVSLGADNMVTIKREKRIDFSSQKLIGVNKVITSSYLISIRNNKKQAIDLKMHDQIPLSQNSNITVEASELSGGKLNASTGEIIWNLKIAPQETKEIILTYSVKYPKSHKVIID